MENLPVQASPTGNLSPRFERKRVLIDWYVSPYQTQRIQDSRSKILKLSTKARSADVLSSPISRRSDSETESIFPELSVGSNSSSFGSDTNSITPYEERPAPGKMRVLGRWKVRRSKTVVEEIKSSPVPEPDDTSDTLATALRLGQSSIKILERDMKKRASILVSPVTTPRRRAMSMQEEGIVIDTTDPIHCCDKILTPTLLRPPSRVTNDGTPKTASTRKPLRPQGNIRQSLEKDY